MVFGTFLKCFSIFFGAAERFLSVFWRHQKSEQIPFLQGFRKNPDGPDSSGNPHHKGRFPWGEYLGILCFQIFYIEFEKMTVLLCS